MRTTRFEIATKLITETTYFDSCEDLVGLSVEERIMRLVKNRKRSVKEMLDIYNTIVAIRGVVKK